MVIIAVVGGAKTRSGSRCTRQFRVPWRGAGKLGFNLNEIYREGMQTKRGQENVAFQTLV